MTRNIQKRLVGSICGILIGAVVTSYAYIVQGGYGQSFAWLGGAIGGITGLGAVTRQLRLHFLGAALGSVASLTLFQVPVCDGSHIGMPLIGAGIGGVLGAIAESILYRQNKNTNTELQTF